MYQTQHHLLVNRLDSGTGSSRSAFVSGHHLLETELITRSCNLVIHKTTQNTMRNQTLRKWTVFANKAVRYCLSQTLMSNVLQYKASTN